MSREGSPTISHKYRSVRKVVGAYSRVHFTFIFAKAPVRQAILPLIKMTYPETAKVKLAQQYSFSRWHFHIIFLLAWFRKADAKTKHVFPTLRTMAQSIVVRGVS